MKKFILAAASFLAATLAISAVWAQEPEVGEAKWTTTIEGDEVVFEAQITPGWHMYDLGPYEFPGLATEFDFSASAGIELVGGVRQLTEPVRKMDDIFGFEIGYFEPSARFAQKFTVTDPANAVLAGEVSYQVCKDGLGCVQGAWDVNVQIAGESAAVSAEGSGNATDIAATAEEADAAETGNDSLWAMILEAILWGFAALLTPCVFPMAPMTVSFFLKDGVKGRLNALMFGVFIILLYTLPIAVIILVTYFAGGEAVTADIFNWLSTHWFPNVLFFLVFMVFAASLFGAFEIRMPSKLINKSDRSVEKGGLAGVFFLALTLVLVSFSCTGPIVGTVLIKSTSGEFWAPIITMFFFSLAFALPFTLLAFFPKLMEKLPGSGGWLNSVKVILGFVEVALGLKFLSVADQTYHWGILNREVYLAIWIVVFTLLGFYLLGKIRFKHDSPSEHIGVGRLSLAIVVFSFVVWLIPGMWGAPLSAISGYLPPMTSQEYVVSKGSAGIAQAASTTVADDGEKIKYSDNLHMPHGLTGYFDFEQGLAKARETGKPVFMDFTGHGCVNCREMESRVWSDPEVLRLLNEKFVILAMYSDDRQSLPESEWLTTPAGKVLKTLGRKNSYIVNTRYGVSAQPAYILLDGNGDPVSPVYGYDLDVQNFINFLNSVN